MRACDSEPEALWRQLIAIYTSREPDDPKVVDAAGKVHAVYERGFGSVTLNFIDNQLNNVRPAPDIRFPYRRRA